MSAKDIKKINCAQAREYDLVAFLAGMGIEPVRIRGISFWYISPFRSERTPSFKINRRLNRWYDFGEGCGGSLIDLATRMHQCTVAELLHMLATDSLPFRTLSPPPTLPAATDKHIEIISKSPLQSAALLSYLKSRKIPLAIAELYCREVRYRIDGRTYFAIGFSNDEGGFELRNEYFKGSSTPKTFTTIRRGAERIAVFEGYFNFLSFLVIMPDEQHTDYMVLNSLSMFERARQVLDGYADVHLYLDNGRSGRNCARYAISLHPRYNDQSGLYQKYDDLNDLLTNRPMASGPSET